MSSFKLNLIYDFSIIETRKIYHLHFFFKCLYHSPRIIDLFPYFLYHCVGIRRLGKKSDIVFPQNYVAFKLFDLCIEFISFISYFPGSFRI